MRLHIHGIGYIGLGLSEPPVQGTARLEKIPIERYTKPGFRRRFGRLSKLLYVASGLALEDCQTVDPSSLSIITATALGEATVSIKLLSQIHASKGKTLSPGFVPNSVHNAPAGYLSIGHQNHQPSITVSQGWLSAEAAVALAQDMATSTPSDNFLIVAGDEVDPDWTHQLREAGAPDLAEAVDREAMNEGAVALIAGVEPGGRRLGSLAGVVSRCDRTPDAVRNLLKANNIYPQPDADVRIRAGTGNNEWRHTVARALDRNPETLGRDGAGLGTSLAGGLATLVDRLNNSTSGELLVLGTEVDDVSALHFIRTAS